jgi:C4-dicarboxylate-specific signal transduction histidine kinase
LSVVGYLLSPGDLLGTTAIANRLLSLSAIGVTTALAVRSRSAQRAMHKAQAELAHVGRVTTLNELSASIAHEVNQPLAAVVTNAEACVRWLDRGTPDLDEARRAAARAIKDGNRASEVIRHIRALSKKTDTQKAPLDINVVANEVVALVQRELVSHRVLLRMELAPALPAVLADRVQLQQVIINLMMNGIEAMQLVTDRPRELVLRSHQDEARQVLITVRDSGVGLSAENADRLFNAFFTTKSDGLGIGLSICRSIIEAHGGRLSASRNVGPGATFQFAPPAYRQAAS